MGLHRDLKRQKPLPLVSADDRMGASVRIHTSLGDPGRFPYEDREGSMFKVGDLAVYPAHGVGKIEAIETKTIGGDSQDFYIMRILENDMKIMIPVQNADMVGLRPLINSEDVPKVYEILQSREISVNSATWNRRYREYM